MAIALPIERKIKKISLPEQFAWIAKVVLMAMLCAWLFRSLLFAPYYVPSSSMMPTLRQGDFFLASRWDYGLSPRSFFAGASPHPRIFSDLPERGDIVVFSPETQPKTNFVKRVIGLPGDVIAMRRGILEINGQKVDHVEIKDFIAPVKGDVMCLVLPRIVDQRAVTPSGEPGCRFSRSVEMLPNGVRFSVLDIAPALTDEVPEITIPEGKVFVAGDNRDNSMDSRIPIEMGGVGLIDADRIHGKLRLVIGRDAQGARFFGARAIAAD